MKSRLELYFLFRNLWGETQMRTLEIGQKTLLMVGAPHQHRNRQSCSEDYSKIFGEGRWYWIRPLINALLGVPPKSSKIFVTTLQQSGLKRRNSVATEYYSNNEYYLNQDKSENFLNTGNSLSLITQVLKVCSIFGFYICVRKLEKFLK